jgi:hypothetical protein
MLLGMANNGFLAINANTAFLLNATTGAYTQLALPGNALCAVPYEGMALVGVQNGQQTTFLLVSADGKTAPVKGAVEGKVLSCSAYGDLLAVSYKVGNEVKVAIYAIGKGGTSLEKTIDLPAVKGADMVLLGPTYTAVYGDSGMYVYKAGKPVQVCSKPVAKARAYGDMALLVLKGANTVILMDVPKDEKVIVITPKEGTVTDALLIENAGPNSAILVGLKNSAKGLVLYRGNSEVMSVGVQNVCSLAANANFVGATTKDPNLGNGVAVVPLAWFMK